VRKLASVLVLGVLLSTVGWSGCRSSPSPEALFAEAEVLQSKYDKDASHDAIKKYRAVITVWERQDRKRDTAKAWHRLGTTYWQLGSLNESVTAYRAALPLAQGSGDHLLESDILSELGTAQSFAAGNADQLREAHAHCARALTLARQAGGHREITKSLACLGEVAYFTQDYEGATGFFTEANRLSDELGDEIGQAQSQLLQGHVHSDLGQFERAESCLDRAQTLWTRLGDTRELAITKVARGRLELRRRNFQAALNQFQEALTSLERMGDAAWEASALSGIALVYREMAETTLALKYWERALNLFEASGLKMVAVDVLLSLGETYLASGEDTLALKRFERALQLAEELGIERWKAWALRFIGVTHLVRRLPVQAREYLDRAAEVQRHVGDRWLDRQLRADFGEAHVLLREHQIAIRYFEEALELSRTGGDRVTEIRALFGLARASLGVNRLDKAQAHIEHALSVAESLRTEVENRNLRSSYVASVYGYYEFYVGVLAKLDKTRPNEGFSAKAFEASERGRARSLLDSLSESAVDLHAGLDPEILRREQTVKLAFDDWAQRSRQANESAAGNGDARRLASEYRDLEERYQLIQAEIRSRSPRYASLARPQPLTLREIQKEVLDRDTVLLEYALGDERSYVWVVSPDTHTLRELPPRAEIEGAAARVYQRLVARLSAGRERVREADIRHADEEYWQEAARLSDILVAPIAKQISGKRLLVVTDGMLQYVPFSALPSPGHGTPPVPLLVEHEIVSLPSASVLAVLRRETGNRAEAAKAVAVFADPVFEADDPRLRSRSRSGGDARATPDAEPVRLRAFEFVKDGRWNVPRLAATRREADAIVAAAPAGMAIKKTGFEASRAAALAPALAQYRIVHFATHGIFDNEDPGLSGLILSLYDEQGKAQDGFLRLHDIYNLQLPAELVVLSACSTALGKQVKGEGLTGMVRGFLYAGARRVVASLWKVDDEATGELMRRFYGGMLQGKRSPAAALRQAQLEMWQQDRWSAPFYWAAFSLQGEWR
jgi:CHAT domain-containing protein/Tfp pilus assembly protein PilF